MQGQGRGFSSPPGHDDRGMAFGFGMNPFSAPEDYGLWGYGFPQPLPPPPPLPRPAVYGRGLPRPPVSLGVQGGGILKRPGGAAQAVFHGRGHARGYGGRAWGGRGGKSLTKEALDADLDEWRLRDKRFAGQSLDAELEDYWRKKEMTEENKSDVVKSFEDVEHIQKLDKEEFFPDSTEAVTAQGSEPMTDGK